MLPGVRQPGIFMYNCTEFIPRIVLPTWLNMFPGVTTLRTLQNNRQLTNILLSKVTLALIGVVSKKGPVPLLDLGIQCEVSIKKLNLHVGHKFALAFLRAVQILISKKFCNILYQWENKENYQTNFSYILPYRCVIFWANLSSWAPPKSGRQHQTWTTGMTWLQPPANYGILLWAK